LAHLAKAGVGETSGGVAAADQGGAGLKLAAGGYQLTIKAGGIEIVASDPEGAANGLASLAQLVDASAPSRC
jgi:hexosaminidase